MGSEVGVSPQSPPSSSRLSSSLSAVGPSQMETKKSFRISASESQRYKDLLNNALAEEKAQGIKITSRPRDLTCLMLAYLHRRHRDRSRHSRQQRPSRMIYWLKETHHTRVWNRHISAYLEPPQLGLIAQQFMKTPKRHRICLHRAASKRRGGIPHCYPLLGSEETVASTKKEGIPYD